jgi:ATP-binding cassette subfamily F protein 3
MIIFRDVSLRRGGRLLLEHVDATLQPGQSIALIGANGTGKSSLFALLLGQLEADAGSVEGMADLRIAHMAQEIAGSAEPAARYVLGGDAELAALFDALNRAEAAGDFARAGELHAQLDDRDGYAAPARVSTLLHGLGFADGDGERAVSEFSGGWRIRLNLARALMQPSDLLLLDEPTNHLDLDATLWLQQWLNGYPGTLLLISHDRDFIDATCERVLHVEGQQLHAYSGGYSDFERLRAERRALAEAEAAKQARRVAEIEAFVSRFRYKATKARQAQSRLRELERMPTLALAHVDTPFEFDFPEPPAARGALVQLSAAAAGYGSNAVLEQLEIEIHAGDRIALLGRNGAGKTTLLRSLTGALPLLGGERVVSSHCRFGYFDQHQVDALDSGASPLLHLQRVLPDAREQALLDFLGGFDFRGDRATDSIAGCSGGEKARLALAIVVARAPNLLVLDEPTNHLDLDMRYALEMALQRFPGAVLLVTHDRHLLRSSADRLWLLSGGRVQDFDGDVEAYERWLLSAPGDSTGAATAAAAGRESGSAKERRQRAAAERERLKPLQKALAETEAALERAQSALETLQSRLADTSLYEEARSEELAMLLREEGVLRQETESLESRWLQQQEELEQLGS